MSKNNNEDIYNELLQDIRKNRLGYDDMLESISEVRKQVPEVLPKPILDSKDFRTKEKYNRFAMEETMKAMSSIFTTELSIRKAKEVGLKTEFDIRRKLAGEDNDSELSKANIDIIAKQIELLYGKKDIIFEDDHNEDGKAD